ncbi:hypothetical protein ARMGADRAFT_1061749 [Armillaria gallica]|uniref:Uncharacterized protein n=1 Tax=Armillaria gallica TaxID=47427 RepID=A0A2H3DQ53_ARMGA|nr:hypothetical protein ARMGADRAFT_1061749 [Armillaria gallica]
MDEEAPINSLLSDDIFILIFAGVTAAATKRPALYTILQMSFVCRRWRTVALSFPELWSTVDICLDARLKWHQVSVSADYRRRRLASKMGLLNLQLHRAGGYKLSVTVHGDYSMDRDALPCINLIHTRVRRWWSLNLLSAGLCPRYVHGLIGSTPSFDSLEVLSVGHTLLEHFYKLGETEPTMPLLRTFCAQLNEADINVRPSLKMARHLGAWSTNVETIICENALCWFPLFKSARKLIIIVAIKRKGDNAEPMPCLSQMPGVHQIGNITSLTFDINVTTHNIRWFGERFRFPNLLHLKILYHKDGTYGPVGDAAELVYMRYPFEASFIENLLQFSPSLSSLTLDKIPMRITQVLAILAPLTSLTRLVIHEPVPCLNGIPIDPLFAPYYPISNRFIEALSKDAYLLPRLKSLELVWRHGVDERVLLDMIECRRQMNLEEVSLGTSYPAPEITEEIWASLMKFQEIGLRVQIVMDIGPFPVACSQPSRS